MSAIHCKIEPNLLTVPETYKIRFIPNNKLMTDDIAAEMCAVAPILTPDVAKTAMSAYHQTIQKNLMNGNHVTVDDSLIYTLSFTGRLDNPEERLLFALLDMQEDGATGEEVAVKENGAYSLPGFADSAVSSLNITVNDYTALWDMLRNDYSGRLVDVLEVKEG